VLETEPFEQFDAAESTMSELEVRTDEHQLRVKGVDEHIRHEVLGLLEAEVVGEFDHDEGVDAGGLQDLTLLVVARERLGAGIRSPC
jgi:hypothetical protein